MKAVVTGGNGYFGRRLVAALHADGFEVVSLDVQDTVAEQREGLTHVQGDVRDRELLVSVFQGAHIVFHTASYGMSMSAQLQDSLIYAINVTGTESVVDACIKNSVPCLVYTSTYNVLFGGQEIVAGDESMSPFPVEQHCDAYSRSKALAERTVLQHNGSALAREAAEKLQTVCIRPAGIYGGGEERHLARAVRLGARGLYKFTFGKRDSVVDWVHVSNLVQAHMLAGKQLLQAAKSQGTAIAAGQVYNISDDEPVNTFEFFHVLMGGLGYPKPKIHLPIGLVYALAWLMEWTWRILHRILPFEPLLLPAEVLKSGVTHYFKMDKARKELGYSPVHYDLATCGAVDWFRDRGWVAKPRNELPVWVWTAIALLSLVVPFLMVITGRACFGLLPTRNLQHGSDTSLPGGEL